MSKKSAHAGVLAVVLPDIHLDQLEPDSVDKLLETLDGFSASKIIIPGDLLQNGQALSDSQFRLITHLRDRRDNLVYIEGNHDSREQNVIAQIIGVELRQEYVLEVKEKKICILHGHRFDKVCFIFDEFFVDRMFDWVMWALKIVNIKGFDVSGWVDYFHTGFANHIAKEAVKYAEKHEYDEVICGHTHVPECTVFEVKKSRKVKYINTGRWMKNSYTYLAIGHDASTELCSAI